MDFKIESRSELDGIDLAEGIEGHVYFYRTCQPQDKFAGSSPNFTDRASSAIMNSFWAILKVLGALMFRGREICSKSHQIIRLCSLILHEQGHLYETKTFVNKYILPYPLPFSRYHFIFHVTLIYLARYLEEHPRDVWTSRYVYLQS